MRFLALVLGVGSACAQTISITAPSASQTIAGFQFTLTSTCSACPTVYSVEYDVDGEVAGITRTPPYSYSWNPYFVGNGQHSAAATYRDVKGNVIATSPANTFSVENPLPQQTSPTTDITVTQSLLAPIPISSGVGATLENIISLHGSGTLSIVGGAPVTNTSGTVNLGTLTAGNLIAVYERWQSTSALSCSDSQSDTFAYGGIQNGSGFSGQWAYAMNIHGGATTVTCTASGSTFLASQGFQIAGAATSGALDVNVTGTTPFVLGYPPANELILAGATWSGVPTASVTPGWPAAQIWQDAGDNTAVEAIVPPSSTFGTLNLAITANGPNAGVSKVFTAFVDGYELNPYSGVTAASQNISFNSAAYYSALPHQVVVRVDGNNCAGCVNGTWSDMGGWERTMTFSNATSAVELVASYHEDVLCTTSSSNCPTSRTYTGTINNTDGSTTAATIASCVSNNTAVVTVSGTCTGTEAGLGFTYLTMTASNGMTRQIFETVMSTNILPHFSTSGQILTAYNPSTSIWHASQFFTSSSQLITLNTYYTQAQFAADYKTAGFNVFEWTQAAPPNNIQTESAWDTVAASDVGTANTVAIATGLKIHLIGDNWARTTGANGSPGLYQSMYGQGQTYATKPWIYSQSAWAATGNVVGQSMVDEVTSSWGGHPLQGLGTGGVVIGTNGFTGLTGNGSTCTVTWSAVNLNGSSYFIITGSGQSTLDYGSAGNTNLFHAAGTTSGFTFPCSYSGTITSGSAQIQPYVNWTFNTSNVGCAPSSEAGSVPCPNYIGYAVFYNMRSQQTGISGYLATTWPSRSGSTGLAVADWCGLNSYMGVTLADYCETYWSEINNAYLPSRNNLSDLQNGQLAAIRSQRPSMNNAKPLLVEAEGVWNDYTIHGYPIPVASCSGSTITFSQDALIRNIMPVSTRLVVSGSSGANCDGNYYVWSSPTATTAELMYQNNAVTATATSGTITWSDTSTTTIGTGGFTNVAVASGTTNNGFINASSDCTIKNKRGETFSISSSGTGLDGLTFGYTFDSSDRCTSYDLVHQLANVAASTGGTAYIIPDNGYLRGRNWQTNSDTGGRYFFASITGPALEGAAGIRQYQYTNNPTYFDRSGYGQAGENGAVNFSYSDSALGYNGYFSGADFNGGSADQAGPDPHWDYMNDGFQAWIASSTGGQLTQRLVKYMLQPRLPSPDYGKFFEATARVGSYGNLLAIQSYADAALSCTANLTPYLISGQPIIRMSGTWAGIEAVTVLSAGTTSDTMTCAPGEFRAYIFSNNEAAELEQPNISASLADIPGAADIVVQYAYSPLVFQDGDKYPALYQTFDCGTGNCTLPVDPQVGLVYFRLVYLDTNSRLLAISAVQTYPGSNM
jgi:hypothetical protein